MERHTTDARASDEAAQRPCDRATVRPSVGATEGRTQSARGFFMKEDWNVASDAEPRAHVKDVRSNDQVRRERISRVQQET